MNAIIGITLQSNRSDLQNYSDIVDAFQNRNIAWEDKLIEIETSALQCVINSDAFTEDILGIYVTAGKCISLLYVYHGGAYAVESLVDNRIIEMIEDTKLNTVYRLLLLRIICIRSAVVDM